MDHDVDSNATQLELRKILLEQEKLAFEREKFHADEAKRQGEVRKLEADIEKVRLETDDLRVPFKQRPAYRTAIFQGAALVLALISAFASTATIKTVLDANKAEYQRTLAENARQQAIDKKNEAERATTIAQAAQEKADSELKNLHRDIGPLQAQYDSTKRDLNVAQLQNRDAGEQLGEARRNISIAPLHDILLKTPIDQPLLSQVLSSDDPNFQNDREKYVEGYAQRKENPLEGRVVALLVLYDLETKKKQPDTLRLSSYRTLILTIAAPPHVGADNVSMWIKLDNVFDEDVVGPYVCPAYLRYQRTVVNILRAEAAFIYVAYSHQPACLEALLDRYDPKYHIAGAGAAYGDSGAIEINFFRCIQESCFSWPTKPSPNFVASIHEAPATFVAAIQQSGDDQQKWAMLKTWASQHQLLDRAFNEPGIPRLRTCTMTVVRRLHDNLFVDEQQLKQYCTGFD